MEAKIHDWVTKKWKEQKLSFLFTDKDEAELVELVKVAKKNPNRKIIWVGVVSLILFVVFIGWLIWPGRDVSVIYRLKNNDDTRLLSSQFYGTCTSQARGFYERVEVSCYQGLTRTFNGVGDSLEIVQKDGE